MTTSEQSERDDPRQLLDAAWARRRSDPPGARALIERARSAAATGGDDAAYGRAHELLGRLFLLDGDEAHAQAPLRAAFAAYDAAGDPLATARVEGLIDALTRPQGPRDDTELLREEIALLRDAALCPPGPDPALIARRSWLEVQRARPLPETQSPSSLWRVGHAFDLTEAELGLLVAALTEFVSPEVPLGLDRATVLAVTLSEPIPGDILAPQGRLRAHRLMDANGIDPDVAAYLQGARVLASGLAPHAHVATPAEPDAHGPLAPRWRDLMATMLAGVPVHITGGDGPTREGQAARLAADLGRMLLVVDLTAAGAEGAEVAASIADIARRESALHGALLATNTPDPVAGFAFCLHADPAPGVVTLELPTLDA